MQTGNIIRSDIDKKVAHNSKNSRKKIKEFFELSRVNSIHQQVFFDFYQVESHFSNLIIFFKHSKSKFFMISAWLYSKSNWATHFLVSEILFVVGVTKRTFDCLAGEIAQNIYLVKYGPMNSPK